MSIKVSALHPDVVMVILSCREMIVNEATFKCSNSVTIRNRVEGSWTYCGDKDFQVKAPCLVFSFGYERC